MKKDKGPSWHKNPVRAVEALLMKVESKLQSEEKFSVGDYIRLLQIHEELGDDVATKVEVQWVEPAEPSVSR